MMFASWKVPSRFTADPNTEQLAGKNGFVTDDLNDVPLTGRGSADFRYRADSHSANARLPRLGMSRSKSVANRSSGRREPRKSSVSPRRSLSRKSATMAGNGAACSQDLAKVFQPHAVHHGAEMLKKAPSTDRKVLQSLLSMAETKQQDDHVIKQSLQPGVLASVSSWMKEATDKDRAVALQFFRSLSATKLMGSTSSEQTARLQDIIQALESGKYSESVPASRCEPRQTRSTELHSSLKHLRLLSPTSRKNRWMETTWHHLPEYRHIDPVNNWTSIYTRPHGYIPRHFTIHPEWG